MSNSSEPVDAVVDSPTNGGIQPGKTTAAASRICPSTATPAS